MPRIAYLGLTPSSPQEGFLQGLQSLGYIEGENITIEWRWADGDEGRLPQLVEELLALNLDVLVVRGSAETRVAMKITSTVPIVFASVTDPVESGFVASLARPGGNVTGVSNFVQGIHGKRLQLLKEAVPRLARIAVLSYFTRTLPANALAWQEVQDAAQRLGVQVDLYDAPGSADLEQTFAAIVRDGADAVTALPSGPVYLSQSERIAALAMRARLPSLWEARVYVEAGGLLFYGVDIVETYRRSATYVDKILKGAKPADLPVERPTRFEFVVNLRTAQALGLTMPPSILQDASDIIR